MSFIELNQYDYYVIRFTSNCDYAKMCVGTDFTDTEDTVKTLCVETLNRADPDSLRHNLFSDCTVCHALDSSI